MGIGVRCPPSQPTGNGFLNKERIKEQTGEKVGVEGILKGRVSFRTNIKIFISKFHFLKNTMCFLKNTNFHKVKILKIQLFNNRNFFKKNCIV